MALIIHPSGEMDDLDPFLARSPAPLGEDRSLIFDLFLIPKSYGFFPELAPIRDSSHGC
jgi:hypothetical protein